MNKNFDLKTQTLNYQSNKDIDEVNNTKFKQNQLNDTQEMYLKKKKFVLI